MASIQKRGKIWFAQVRRSGVSQSRSFTTKAEALAWSVTCEAEIISGKQGTVPDKTFGDLLRRYRDTVSTGKRGARWETIRLNMILGEGTSKADSITQVKLEAFNESHVARWRDDRATHVSPGSVLREWTLLSHACSVGLKEWKWLTRNPFSSVRRPKAPEARIRRIRDEELERLMFAFGYDRTQVPTTLTSRVGAAFLFAIETAMRAGEITGLTQDRVFERHVHLDITKNGTRRDVPLSVEARRILDQLPKDHDTVFGIASVQLDSLFRKGKARCLIDDLHFHDSRHEALTRLSAKLNVMELAKMAGIRDLRILQNVYYNPDIADLADKL